VKRPSDVTIRQQKAYMLSANTFFPKTTACI